MAARKINLMHQMFGTAAGKCGDCDHLVEGRYHDRMLRKCEVYGLTHSEASDWAKRWNACGLFNKETNHKNVMRLVGAKRVQPKEPLEGQIGLEANNDANKQRVVFE